MDIRESLKAENSSTYNIIYADPPWYFKTYSDKGNKRSAMLHYNCLDIHDIYNLPVNRISNNDCILFLWVIDPMLPEAMEVIKNLTKKQKSLHIFTCSLDKSLDKNKFIVPGLGDAGDRYMGT